MDVNDSPTTYPTTLINKGELHCEDSAQNITCWAGQIRVFFFLYDYRFLPNSLANCNGASGYVACCLTRVGLDL